MADTSAVEANKVWRCDTTTCVSAIGQWRSSLADATTRRVRVLCHFRVPPLSSLYRLTRLTHSIHPRLGGWGLARGVPRSTSWGDATWHVARALNAFYYVVRSRENLTMADAGGKPASAGGATAAAQPAPEPPGLIQCCCACACCLLCTRKFGSEEFQHIHGCVCVRRSF